MVVDDQLLFGGDDIPRDDLGNQCLDGLIFLSYVVPLEFLDVLRVNGHNDGFNRHRVNHVLEGVFLTLDLLVLLELEVITPLGIVHNSWVEELGLGEPLAVEVTVPGGESHFGPAEDELEEPVTTIRFGCRKMDSKCHELLNEVFHGVEGGLPYNYVEQNGFHPPSHHFGDVTAMFAPFVP